jgi:Flp pilus assembly pilin Flp
MTGLVELVAAAAAGWVAWRIGRHAGARDALSASQPTPRGPLVPAQVDVRSGTARERGASAVEYGLLVASIAVVITAAVFGLGTLVKQSFKDLSSTIEKCSPAAEQCAQQGSDPGNGAPADPAVP